MSNSSIVSKFGGTSVADYDAMLNCFNIINENPDVKVVVLSASAGVTNLLVELAEGRDKDKRKEILDKIRLIQFNIINRLKFPEEIAAKIESCLTHITSLSEAASLATNDALAAAIVAHGEIMSTMIFTHLCLEKGAHARFLDAREVIVTDAKFASAQVDIIATQQNAHIVLEKMQSADNNVKVITQGFIGREADGKTTTLGRGGSDYSAALFAEVIKAKAVHIWTDVSGIYTTDPRIVKQACRIDNISFREASEMAVFGAKVLHPATIVPAVRSNIPVFIGNSKQPHEGGTWVTHEVTNPPPFRGIAFKRNQSIITIHSLKMLGASGFLSKVFDVFTKHGVVIDCVTTSEVSVAVTVDYRQNNNTNILDNQELLDDLGALGKVTIDEGYALIALIGNQLQASTVLTSTLNVLEQVPIRMICQGASEYNLCILVPVAELEPSIRKLHSKLFE